MGRILAGFFSIAVCMALFSSCKSRGNSGLTSVELLPNRHAPGPSSMHSAHWTGSQMLIWGGIIAYEDRGSRRRSQNMGHRGWVFEPGSGLWRPMPRSKMIQRYSHASTYSGGVLVVWGGSEGGVLSNTGEMLNLADQHWFDMALDGAPSARMGHSAVAIGDSVVIWGGEDERTTFADGAIFHPDDNTWRKMSAPEWLSARAYHGAVAAGDLMVIWGGVGEDGNVVGDGAVYDFNTDEWYPMAGQGEPSGRFGHSFVWTGSQLIVWGGRREVDGVVTYLRDGGIYDLDQNRWQTIPASASPPGRELHTSVWTGSEVVVLGGSAGNRAFRGGGAFDPVRRRWRAIEVPSEIPARYQHSAVWTGREILVWGGVSSPHQVVNGNETGLIVVP